jgi:transposase
MPARPPRIEADRLRHYVAQGMTARAIAERTGRTRHAVYSALRAAGMDTHLERKTERSGTDASQDRDA